MTQHAPNYQKTEGLKSLIGRRAIWGEIRGRVVGVILAEDGAYAEFRPTNRDTVHQIRVDRLSLVPHESLPVEERLARDTEISTGS